MNEQIKLLVEQANLSADKTYQFDPKDGFKIQEWDKIRLEKFAELIVRKCIKVMEEPDYGSEHDFVIVDTGERIKKHFSIRIQDLFGVEE